MPHIDYFVWMNSDWAYLGGDRLLDIARRHGVAIRYRPVDLPDVYLRTGGVLLGQRAPARQAYRVTELKRWCRKLGIEVNPTPRFMCPNADLASRVVIAASRQGLDVHALHMAILRAQWREDRDISSRETLLEILSSLGIDGEELLSLSIDPAIESIYRDNTDAAVRAGVFGSPSYVFEGELFWGQDRLGMLEEAIVAEAARG